MQDGRYPSCVVGACTSVHADQLRPIDHGVCLYAAVTLRRGERFLRRQFR